VPPPDLPEPLRRLVEPGADGLLALDFDGTLSPIVDDPATAAPLEGVPELLERLAARVGELAVISGRPLSYLTAHLPTTLTLVGLYGLETLRGGEQVDHPSAGVWRETMADVARGAELRGPAGMTVELKGASITLHYRQHPELADQVAKLAAESADLAGLRVRPARMSVELHPPIDEDKGTALARLAAERRGPVVFAGDDVGDLTAFATLDRLAAAGRPVLRIAVDSTEAPDELRRQADLVVDGPPGFAELLRSVLAEPSAA